jgi:hypothetical protein
MSQTPEQVVDRQLAAYNSHNLDELMATYSSAAQTLVFPTNEILDDGAEAVHKFFQSFFDEGRPHVEIDKRIVSGNFVIGDEVGSDLRNGNWQGVAIYEVIDGLIQRVWFPPASISLLVMPQNLT